MSEKKKNIKIASSISDAGPYLGLGTQLAATFIIMFFLGWWIDNNFDTKPVFIIICTFFGGFAGIYNFIKTVLNLNEKKKNENNS